MGGVVGWIAGSGLVQGLIIGGTLAFLTAVLVLDAVVRARTTHVNGWKQVRGIGERHAGVLVRAAMQKALPVANVLQEAAYWTADADASGRRFTGSRTYALHFPTAGLPPCDAFWSLTVTDPTGYMAHAHGGRSSMSSTATVITNADGSVDVRLGAGPGPDERVNRLAVPRGRFSLTLRAYLPGRAILEGEYRPPAVVEVGR